MVVLSVGLNPPADHRRTGGQIRNRAQFPRLQQSDSFQPMETNRPGDFCERRLPGPHGYSRIGVSAPAGPAPNVVNSSTTGGGNWPRKGYIRPERDVSEEEPRIGVFVCHCGANIGSVVNVPSTVEYALSLPNVVYAQEQLFSCATNSAKEITDLAKEKGLNRVVIGGLFPADPRTAVPGHASGGRAQSVLLRDGEYPGALFLGPLQAKGRGHRKGPGYHPHVGGAGPPSEAAAGI